MHLELPDNAIYAITKNVKMCHMIVKNHKFPLEDKGKLNRNFRLKLTCVNFFLASFARHFKDT